MPRQGRLDAPGVLHHIMIRGIERRNIIRDDQDREDLLARLARLLPETQTICYAWALMPNHAHVLLRTGVVPLATVMRRLLTGYAVRFNHRWKRHHRHRQFSAGRAPAAPRSTWALGPGGQTITPALGRSGWGTVEAFSRSRERSAAAGWMGLSLGPPEHPGAMRRQPTATRF